MEEKKYTQQEVDHMREYFRMEGENKLLMRILEQKLDIELLPKIRF